MRKKKQGACIGFHPTGCWLLMQLASTATENDCGRELQPAAKSSGTNIREKEPFVHHPFGRSNVGIPCAEQKVPIHSFLISPWGIVFPANYAQIDFGNQKVSIKLIRSS